MASTGAPQSYRPLFLRFARYLAARLRIGSDLHVLRTTGMAMSQRTAVGLIEPFNLPTVACLTAGVGDHRLAAKQKDRRCSPLQDHFRQ